MPAMVSGDASQLLSVCRVYTCADSRAGQSQAVLNTGNRRIVKAREPSEGPCVAMQGREISRAAVTGQGSYAQRGLR